MTEPVGAMLVLGLGVSDGAAVADALVLVQAMLAEAQVGPERILAIATLDRKVDADPIQAVASHLGRSVQGFSAARLDLETPRLRNPSAIVFRAVGCHGVAEGAALAAAGPDAELVVDKRRLGKVTAALAGRPSAHF